MISWRSPPGKAGGREVGVLGCRRPVPSSMSFLLLALGKKERSLHSTTWGSGSGDGSRDRKGARPMEIQDQSICQQNLRTVMEHLIYECKNPIYIMIY